MTLSLSILSPVLISGDGSCREGSQEGEIVTAFEMAGRGVLKKVIKANKNNWPNYGLLMQGG